MTRRILVFILFLATLPPLTQAQTDTVKLNNNKWTVGTILVNQSYKRWYDQTFFSFFDGIVIKRHYAHLTARFGLEYINRAYRDERIICCDAIQADGYENEMLVRIGFEKLIIKTNRFNSYFALDVAGLRSYADLIEYGDVGYPRLVSKKTGLGLITSLGFEYKFNSQFSLGLETRGKFIYTKTENDNLKTDFPGLVRGSSSSKQLKNSFEGIGALTLNVSF